MNDTFSFRLAGSIIHLDSLKFEHQVKLKLYLFGFFID